jgi:primary-amine oxidase
MDEQELVCNANTKPYYFGSLSPCYYSNYDYLLDYIFKQDGVIKIAVGATGQDITQGVKATSTSDESYEEETMYGTLIAENLVAPNHDHFFNFRLDLDVDGPDNSYVKGKYVRQEVDRGIPRKSIWKMEKEVIESEIHARTKIDPMNPSMFLFGNKNVEGALGHNPMYRLQPGEWAHSLLAEDDVPYVSSRC